MRDCSPSVEDGWSHGTSKACEQARMLVTLNSSFNKWEGWKTSCCDIILLEIPTKSVQTQGIHVPALKLTEQISGRKERMTHLDKQ